MNFFSSFRTRAAAAASLAALAALLTACAVDPNAPATPVRDRVEPTTGSRVPKSSVGPVQSASGVYVPGGGGTKPAS